MNVTRFTDYALRTLIYLGTSDAPLSTIQEIAEAYSISKNHLMKVVQELSSAGYIEAIRGKKGGIKLKGEAADINIGDVVRRFEQGSPLVECFGQNNRCLITPACSLKKIFADAMNQFFNHLDGYSLDSLIRNEQKVEILKLLDGQAYDERK